MTVITGLDVLLDEKSVDLKNIKFGMITNHTSVTKDLKLGIEELLKRGFQIKKVFGPEHGFRGSAAAGAKVHDERDERTGLPVYSLYGSSKKPTKEMLEGLDALLFDMQDIGVRYYTYIYTMAYAMEAAAENNLDFYVLDRPNPLTGMSVEGNILDLDYRSFVGYYPIPIRHGLTIGELARLFNEEYKIGCSLKVITMKGWQRSQWFDETGLPWVMPSPNTTGLEMAVLYPGTCLFEGTTLSEGRGTARPFEIIGAPWIDCNQWGEALNRLDLEGARFRATYFTPYTSKHAGELCQGVQIHITDKNRIDSISIGILMIESLKRLYPDHFAWLPPYQDKYFIDLLSGTDGFRQAINKGTSISTWYKEQKNNLTSFLKIREKYLLYHD